MSDVHVVCMNETLYVGGGCAIGTLKLDNDAKLFSFELGVDRTWRAANTPTYGYALATYDSQLLLVGGCVYHSEELTNRIYTLRDTGEIVEMIPPMKEKRWSASAVSYGSMLVVAGGQGVYGELSSVEVFNNGEWIVAPSLPRAGEDMKSALHGDSWYLIHQDSMVFSVSLQSLVYGLKLSPWETLPDAPSSYSAAAFFGGHLLSIGGEAEDQVITSAIHAFCFSSQSWKHVGNLPLPLSYTTATVLPTGELMVIGGDDEDWNRSCDIFISSLEGLLTLYRLPMSPIITVH